MLSVTHGMRNEARCSGAQAPSVNSPVVASQVLWGEKEGLRCSKY